MTSFDDPSKDQPRDASGQFASTNTGPTTADVLDGTSAPSGPTLQSDGPLERMSLNAFNKPAGALCADSTRSDYILDTPYQRGSVWSTDQRRALVNSMLRGIPVPAIIINDRMNDDWKRHNGEPDYTGGEKLTAVVDGKQRLETLYAWKDGELSVPASWFSEQQIETAEDTDDGPYVRYTGLTKVGQRMSENHMQLPVAEGKLESVEAEARLFRLVNGGGVAQTDGDMARAAAVENG